MAQCNAPEEWSLIDTIRFALLARRWSKADAYREPRRGLIAGIAFSTAFLGILSMANDIQSGVILTTTAFAVLLIVVDRMLINVHKEVRKAQAWVRILSTYRYADESTWSYLHPSTMPDPSRMPEPVRAEFARRYDRTVESIAPARAFIEKWIHDASFMDLKRPPLSFPQFSEAAMQHGFVHEQFVPEKGTLEEFFVWIYDEWKQRVHAWAKDVKDRADGLVFVIEAGDYPMNLLRGHRRFVDAFNHPC